MDRDERKQLADFTIDNSGEQANLKEQVASLHARLLQLVASKNSSDLPAGDKYGQYESFLVPVLQESSVSDEIVYEQPLNERVRTFLRLEYLFEALENRIRAASEWDSRDAIAYQLNITDLLSRSDIKSELIKELERHATTLINLKANPGVDPDRLNTILERINVLLQKLKDKSCQPGQAIRKCELMNSVKQRSSIPGGTCNFDLPGFHFWLNQATEKRSADLELLGTDLQVIHDSVALSLHMIRNSTVPTREVAEKGFFQQPIEGELSCQLVRVVLPVTETCYPEISGGKHRFTIRFLQQSDISTRPVQTDQNVSFVLHCCIL